MGSEKIRIFIADDQDLVRSGYKAILSTYPDFEIAGMAKDGNEAVELAQQLRPDVILMDIRMPDMNGIQATKIIKEVSPKTPVIALSAFAFEDTIREAKAVGCDDFMSKPFKVEDLIEIIKKYIGE